MLTLHTGQCSHFLLILHTAFALQPVPRSLRKRTEKFDKNITKRGNVPVGKAAMRQDEFPASKILIAFILVVVVGSSVVQILNMFGTSKPPA
jgi:Ribosome associated membrane protein RAMP4